MKKHPEQTYPSLVHECSEGLPDQSEQTVCDFDPSGMVCWDVLPVHVQIDFESMVAQQTSGYDFN